MAVRLPPTPESRDRIGSPTASPPVRRSSSCRLPRTTSIPMPRLRSRVPSSRSFRPCRCKKRDENDPDEVFQDHPVVLFEVLSDSTARTDREEKLRACQTIKTLRVYAILESDGIGVTCYERAEEEEDWTVRSLKERSQSLPLTAIGCTLPLDTLYARTSLSPQAMARPNSSALKRRAPYASTLRSMGGKSRPESMAGIPPRFDRHATLQQTDVQSG